MNRTFSQLRHRIQHTIGWIWMIELPWIMFLQVSILFTRIYQSHFLRDCISPYIPWSLVFFSSIVHCFFDNYQKPIRVSTSLVDHSSEIESKSRTFCFYLIFLCDEASNIYTILLNEKPFPDAVWPFHVPMDCNSLFSSWRRENRSIVSRMPMK